MDKPVLPDLLLPYIIDRAREQELFSQILTSENKRILMISGEGGMGKTSLLNLFATICKQQSILFSSIKLRYTPVSPIDILSEITMQINNQSANVEFGNFRDAIKYLSEPTFQRSDFKPEVAESKKSKVIKLLTGDLRKAQPDIQGRIDDAFFKDLYLIERNNSPIVFLFDDMELIGPQLKNWFINSFIGKGINVSKLITVTAGRNAFEKGFIWEKYAARHKLGTIGVNDWKQYAKYISETIPDETVEKLNKKSLGFPLAMAVLLERLALAGKGGE